MIRRLLASLVTPLLLAGCITASPDPADKRIAPPPPKGGVVSAADPRAAAAGIEMLRAGGSAVDAALAMMVALTVVEPQSSGIGGGGYMITDSGDGRAETIDGRETAPAAAHPRWFEVDGKPLSFPQAVPGGLSVGIPGNLRLMADAHARHGKLAWARLFDPAIRLAREGFLITPRLQAALVRSRGTAALTEAGRALFFGPDGAPLPVGTLVRNPALASFLQRLAADGPDAFYTGENARSLSGAVANAPRNPAALTEADVAAYRAKRRPPLCFAYRSYRICSMGPSSSGATTLAGILVPLERFDLTGLGKDSPTSWHLIVEAERLAYADRERWLADADFVKVPAAGLLAPDYLRARSALIAPDRTLAAAAAGTPRGAPAAQGDTLTPDVPSTTHFVAVDRAGRVASMTSTIESAFGSGLVVNGYYLNNEMTDFSLVPMRDGRMVANRVEGGKRPLSSMSPTLVYAPDGRLRLAIGAAGGKTIPAQVAKAIIGVIDWKLSAQDAIALPLIYAPGGEAIAVEKGTTLEAMIPALRALGHARVDAYAMPLKANAIEWVNGKLAGAADPRSEGQALAE